MYDFEPIWMMVGKDFINNQMLTHFDKQIVFLNYSSKLQKFPQRSKLYPVKDFYKLISTSRI